MDTQAKVLQVYKQLATCYERRGQAQMRDRFLVLAADAAHASGRTDEAEQLRARLLQVNPHHLLKPYTSFAQAREAPDVETYVRSLRQNYPEDVAEDLLRAIQASEDPGSRKLQVTAPIPEIHGAEEATLRLESQAAPSGQKIRPDPEEDEMSQTAALPPTRDPPLRSRKTAAELAPTLPFDEPQLPRARVAMKRDYGATEKGTLPVTPRPTTTGPTSSRPARSASSGTPAPAVSGSRTSPFATIDNDSAPTHRTGQRFQSAEEPADQGGWLASLLFVIVGTLVLLFAAFALARPFLPDGWLAR